MGVAARPSKEPSSFSRVSASDSASAGITSTSAIRPGTMLMSDFCGGLYQATPRTSSVPGARPLTCGSSVIANAVVRAAELADGLAGRYRIHAVQDGLHGRGAVRSHRVRRAGWDDERRVSAACLQPGVNLIVAVHVGRHMKRAIAGQVGHVPAR